MTTPEIKGPLTIAGLTAENVKRITVVKLKPDGSVVQITGDNEQGKSSVLDAIWLALDYAHSVKPTQPIRKGAEEAVIKLDLGEIIVTRTFRRKEDSDPPYTTSLKIEAANGARFNSPQTLLDGLIGSLSFEPLEFMKRDDKGKFDALKAFVEGVDFDAIDGQNKSDYEERTNENRKAKELKAQAAGIMVPEGKHERIDVTKVVADLEEAEVHNAEIATRTNRRQAAETERRDLELECQRIDGRIAAMQKERDEAWERALDLEKRLAAAEPLPDEIDTAALRDQITKAQTVNANADKAERKAELMQKAAAHESASQALTDAMEARAEHVRASIANAKMPVPGLTLADGRVFLNDLPLDQASTAQKLKLSVAVAMALNSKIRVIRITEGGNDLDKGSMAMLYKMAAENGFQVWVERINALGGPPAIVMVDGHAAG